jgi:glutamate-1-semialdehyde 2,1-aminomutase
MVKESEKIKQHIIEKYTDRTKGSRERDAHAKKRLPGGDTRSATYFFPHPLYMVEGKGCHLYDCDGNEYIDLLNNYTSLIHGHAHPRVTEAARLQLEKGTVLGSPAEIQYVHAEHLCGRVPSLEMVRYCNSGTEATLFAMRAARAFTRREIFIKMDGGYHGSHDFVDINVMPDASGQDRPVAHLERGVPACVLDDVQIVPYNDLEAVEQRLEQYKDKVAAIILEPMLGAGGLIPPKTGYLQGMRELADRYGVVLIFDEIITFRLSTGGMQAISGVTPDLTTLGKIIGGGFPVGAFGGRKEIMERFDPAHPESVMHSGTFNGNNITMAAGLATMELYDQEAVDRLNGLGNRMRKGFQDAMKKVGIKGQTTGYGSLIGVGWREGAITKARDTLETFMSSGELPKLLHLEMLTRGIYYAGRGLFALSTPMTEREVDRTIEVFEDALKMLKPYVAETLPQLLRN